MTPQRPSGDLSSLPTVVFGSRHLMWWGTVGFMVIEGWTLALLAAMYVYLRQNFVHWPPAGIPLPSLTVPTINLAIMLLSIVPARASAAAARKLDTRGVRRAVTWLSL